MALRFRLESRKYPTRGSSERAAGSWLSARKNEDETLAKQAASISAPDVRVALGRDGLGLFFKIDQAIHQHLRIKLGFLNPD